MKIEVEIEYFGDIAAVDQTQAYLASIKEGEYKGTIVTAGSVADCFKELGISIFVINAYRNNKSK
jgi:hypothetical protein